MVTNRWIETSSKLYSAFLNLYPKEHRAEYGDPMRQVFADQCRSAYGKKGMLGVVQLWLRTLPDLGYTAFLEHITSPQAGLGLMEPVPNAPLPWKGIFLILLPGLVYLVSQIAQLTGQPWYLTVYYRAAFLLILPVLAVWAATRRFPIWGLIPLGLLYRLLQEIGYQLIVLHPNVFSSNPLLNLILTIAKQIQKELLTLVTVFTVVTLFLAWRYLRLHKPPRSFWLWLGIYVLTVIIQLSVYLSWIVTLTPEMYISNDVWVSAKEILSWNLYDATTFICLIFIGTLFTRRHGFFAILIPVGYILPAMLIGIPWNIENLSTPALLLTAIYVGILAYRALLSLVAPIWMSRSGSLVSKKHAVLVSIAGALIIYAVMQFSPLVLYPGQVIFSATWVGLMICNEIKLISGILLGISMYQNDGITATNPPGESPEKHSSLSVQQA